LGDFDNDGDLDALVGPRSGVAVVINQGRSPSGQEGRFTASGSDIAGSWTRPVNFGGLDGDSFLNDTRHIIVRITG
jgi:hypothetical protein